MMKENPNSNQQQPIYSENPPKRYLVSTGGAIVLGISAIIITAIIVAAIIFLRGVDTIDDFNFDGFQGIDINVDEQEEKTNINVELDRNDTGVVDELGGSLLFNDDKFNLFTIEYGQDFDESAISYDLASGSGSVPDMVAGLLAHSQATAMYGTNPEVKYLTVDGQDAGYIVSSNTANPMTVLTIMLPAPQILSSGTYDFLQIYINGDQAMLPTILDTFSFK